MTLLSALLFTVACAGNEVKFAPLIAGSVPVKFAAGSEVKFAPDPTKLVAVTIPALPIFILLPTLICVDDVTIPDTTRPSSSPPIVPDP